MNVKKAIKRIAVLAAGTAMVTATIMGAMAYDLGDYPEPLVKNGVFNGKIVVGKTAQVSDVIGAIDLAASLQAAAATPVDAAGSTATVSVTGGVQLKSSSTDLHFEDAISSVNSGTYDNDEFPELLADGEVEDEDGTTYDYEQSIEVPDSVISFGQDDDYSDDPVFYLDLAAGADDNLYFKVDFTDTLNISELEDSESIEMFGKVYTFDPNHDAGDDVTLYGSDVTVTVTQNEPQTVKMDGEEYKIEILGGNTGDSSAIVRVSSGSDVEVKTLQRGDSRDMAGLDVFIEDVFISDIGEDTISVSIFVGSEKIVIPNNALDATCAASAYEEIEIGADDSPEIYACILSSGDIDETDGLYFSVDPTNFDNAAIDDDWSWLVMGEEYEVPFFDFTLAFDGLTPGLEDRPMAELTRKSDMYALTFENNDDDEYTIELVQTDDGADLKYGYDEKFVGAAQTNISEDDFFILESQATDLDDIVTYILEVDDVDPDAPATVTIEGKDYRVGKEILDTGVTIAAIGSDKTFTLSAASKERIIANGGMEITWEDANLTSGTAGWFEVNFTEETDDFDDVAVGDVAILQANITAAGTDDIDMGSATWLGSTYANATAADTDSNNLYGISEYGTWFNEETDNENDYLKVYYANEETDFDVFLNGPDAVVVSSGSSSGDAYVINDMVVGQIAIYDDEALSMIGKTPLLAVGGPCVNDVARELMGNPEVCAEGFTEGRAIIKLWESQNAILVAGYSGDDTTGGAQVLAAYQDYALSGDEVEVITTDLKNLEVNSVE